MLTVSALDLSYAAGAIDADGCLTIRRSTNRMRGDNRDCRNPIYSPRVMLAQVKPMVPEFLKATFGGSIHLKRNTSPNGFTSFRWLVSDRSAVVVARLLLPHLKIKGEQAAAIIELDDLKKTPGVSKASHWYAAENPDWRTGPLLTYSEAATRLGYTDSGLVTQAINNGTLLAANRARHGRTALPRIPAALVDVLISLKGTGKRYISPPQFLAAQHAIWERVREMNKVGVHGTPSYYRTGPFAPAG